MKTLTSLFFTSYHNKDNNLFFLEINKATTTKSEKSKKEKNKDSPKGSIQKMFFVQISGSKMKLMQNGELVSNITLKMACFNSKVSGDNDADK